MPGQTPSLGPLCPDCGAPLRFDGDVCRRCGFSPREPALTRAGLMTPFGHGFCGVGIGLLLAMVLGLAGETSALHSRALIGLLACAAGARITSWVGCRLAPGVRCAYEHLLISLLLGGVATLAAAAAASPALSLCGLVWLGCAAATYLLLRRYGYRAVRIPQSP